MSTWKKLDDAWLDRMIERSILRGESEDFRMGRIRAKMFPDEPEADARKFFSIMFDVHMIGNEIEAMRGYRFQREIEEETRKEAV